MNDAVKLRQRAITQRTTTTGEVVTKKVQKSETSTVQKELHVDNGVAGIGKHGAPPMDGGVVREKSALVGLRTGKIDAPVSVRGYAVHSNQANIVSPDNFLYHSDGRYEWTPQRLSTAWTNAYAQFEKLLADPKVTKAQLLVGVPGAGKTTWLQKNNDPTVAVFDACLWSPQQRSRLIAMAQRAGKPVDAVWLNTPIDTALARNASRPENRRVPEEKMRAWSEALQHEPPRTTEGFANVHVVGGEYVAPAPSVVYAGAFLGDDGARKLLARFPAKHAMVFADHLTLHFKPREKDVEAMPVGRNVQLKIIGIAEDHKAQALVIEPVGVSSTNPIPHITLSTTEGTPPSYSNELLAKKPFVRFDEPVVIEARVGLFMSDQKTRFA